MGIFLSHCSYILEKRTVRGRSALRKRARIRVPLQQYKQLFLYIAILLIGIGMGLIAVHWVDEQQCSVAKTALEQAVAGTVDCKQVFSTSAWDHVKPVLWIWLAGFFPFFMAVSGFAVWYKGVFFGYGAGMLIKLYGGRGLLLILSTFLPQYLFYLPALVLFAYFCSRAFSQRSIYKEGLLKYLLLFVLGIVICWFCALLDGYVVAKLMKWVRF